MQIGEMKTIQMRRKLEKIEDQKKSKRSQKRKKNGQFEKDVPSSYQEWRCRQRL